MKSLPKLRVACCERPFCWRPPHHPSSSSERNRPSQKTGPTKRIGQVYSKVVTSLESGPGKEAFFPRCVIVTPRDVMSVQCQSKGLCSGGRDLQRRPLDSAKCLHIDVQAVQMGDCISLLHIQHPCCQMPCKWHTIPHLVRVQARAQVSTFAYRSE